MKKILVLPVLLSLLVFSCTKMAQDPMGNVPDLSSTVEVPVNTNGVPFGRTCATYEVHQKQLKENPGLAKKMAEIEAFSQKVSSDPSAYRLVNGVYEIPVVVNVLYYTAAENISDLQIQSQIDVLNADFAATNTDISKIPSTFNNVKAGNINIRFVRDQIIRKSTTKTSWGTNNSMKSSLNGGLDAVSPATKLNMWVCTIGGGILGYAQFPGGSSATDGVVIDSKYFGKTNISSPYNLGRTATHEVGHWLNLRHIWGDSRCGNDQVNDTPAHNAANYGCPATGHKSLCKGSPVEMTMNYMDYTDDACMYMFSAGQKTRMLALFAPGGFRNSFAQP
jgi:hypothetical protein